MAYEMTDDEKVVAPVAWVVDLEAHGFTARRYSVSEERYLMCSEKRQSRRQDRRNKRIRLAFFS